MSGQRHNWIRLIIPTVLIAIVAFSAGALVVVKYLSLPSDFTWTGKTFFPGKLVGDALINGFHNLFYNRRLFAQGKWLGVRLLKYPTDLLVYQEMIYELKPDVILDIGTFLGGSALYYASMLDLMGPSSRRVISVDIQHSAALPEHPRITYLLGSSTSKAILEQIKGLIRPGDKVLVFLDSDHNMQHVLNELRAYGQIVTKGSYIVVEDSNINGHPVAARHGPGPMEAIHAFLKEDSGFKVDKSREKYLLTVAPDGFLLKL